MSELLQRVELGPMPANFSFPAGMMCWLKAPILTRMADLSLQAEDFEPECGQTDGTFAHGIERLLGVMAAAQDMTVQTPATIAPQTS
ncbi:rhamnan synthesis F family protein [Candidatus Rhodobacter oscarellae]|nr:rhamnan synthesis F family protein [Candidatus Rhodobacter lobularis]